MTSQPNAMDLIPDPVALAHSLREAWSDRRSVRFREHMHPQTRAWLEAVTGPLPEFPDATQEAFEVLVRILLRVPNAEDVEGIIDQRLSGAGAVLDYQMDEPERVRVLRPYKSGDHFEKPLMPPPVVDEDKPSPLAVLGLPPRWPHTDYHDPSETCPGCKPGQ